MRWSPPSLQWYMVDHAELSTMECAVAQETVAHGPIRKPGGVLIVVLPCGLIIDWAPVWRGESLHFAFLLLMRVLEPLADSGIPAKAILYDWACKLLRFVRRRKDACPPWSQLVAELPIILDRFHGDNHVWCLRELPAVDPFTERSEALLAGVQLEDACEQCNAFVTPRAHPLHPKEFNQGEYVAFWRQLFMARNRHLVRQAACPALEGGSAAHREMSRSEADIAYTLLESKHSFPSVAIAGSHPLCMKLSEALVKGLSLHGVCVYGAFLCSSALLLSAVKIKFSGTFGV